MGIRWVKVHEKIIEWGWYKKPNMFHLFFHLIVKANWKPGVFEGRVIKRGQLVTGRNSLSKETGISEQSIRTCLKLLKSTSEITIKTTSRFSLITVCNYETYQCDDREGSQVSNQVSNQQLTSDQPATNHNSRSIEEVEYKEKEIKQRKRNVTEFSESVLRVFDLFCEKAEVNPKTKTSETDWKHSARLMMSEDKYTEQEIIKMIVFVAQDVCEPTSSGWTGWKRQIKSLTNLRKKADTIVDRMPTKEDRKASDPYGKYVNLGEISDEDRF